MGTILYTLAVQNAAEQVATAVDGLETALKALGNIHRGALSEGMLRHLKLQRAKIDVVLKETKYAYKAMDFNLDDERLLGENGEEE